MSAVGWVGWASVICQGVGRLREKPCLCSSWTRNCAWRQGPVSHSVPQAGLPQSITSLLFSWAVITAPVWLVSPGFQAPRQKLLREATWNHGKMGKAEHLCSIPSSSTTSCVTWGKSLSFSLFICHKYVLLPYKFWAGCGEVSDTCYVGCWVVVVEGVGVRGREPSTHLAG